MTSRSAPAPESALDTIKTLLELVVVTLFITTFLVQSSPISSASMDPTLRVGDLLLLDMQSFSPAPHGPLAHLLPPSTVHRGDVVVFHFPPDPSRELVKRAVGLPGDRLRLHNGLLFLNGLPIPEPYAVHNPAAFDVYRDDFPSLRSTDPNVDPRWWVAMRRALQPLGMTGGSESGEITVPAGHIFVLGDNRDNSEDSRYWGFVPFADLIGRPLLVYANLAQSQTATPPEPGHPDLLARLAHLRQEVHVIR